REDPEQRGEQRRVDDRGRLPDDAEQQEDADPAEEDEVTDDGGARRIDSRPDLPEGEPDGDGQDGHREVDDDGHAGTPFAPRVARSRRDSMSRRPSTTSSMSRP